MKTTHQNLIRKHLKQGKSISGLAALRLFGCYRLSAVIFKLRQEGMNIKTTIKKGTHYASYKVIKQNGK